MGAVNAGKAILVLALMLLTSQSTLLTSSNIQTQESIPTNLTPVYDGESIIETPQSNENSIPRITVFTPSLEHWTDQGFFLVEVVVITSDILALHHWQGRNNLLPTQAEGQNNAAGTDFPNAGTSSRLVPSNVESLAGVLQHRSLTPAGKLRNWLLLLAL